MKNPKHPELKMYATGKNIYLTMGGVRIAKRGHPGTPQAGTWVSLEPGYVVRDSLDGEEIIVEHHGVRMRCNKQNDKPAPD
jgi:hypothetical protein